MTSARYKAFRILQAIKNWQVDPTKGRAGLLLKLLPLSRLSRIDKWTKGQAVQQNQEAAVPGTLSMARAPANLLISFTQGLSSHPSHPDANRGPKGRVEAGHVHSSSTNTQIDCEPTGSQRIRWAEQGAQTHYRRRRLWRPILCQGPPVGGACTPEQVRACSQGR